MSEFFKFIEISLQNNLADWIKIMYKKLKKNINIPRYEYGSSGNLVEKTKKNIIKN